MQRETFVFFGIVGSGKGTQVKLLMDFLKAKDGTECVYIGTGDIFRKIIESTKNGGPSADKAVAEILASGKLMPDSDTNRVVSDALKSQFSPDKHLLFDGYPRTIAQSEYFTDLVKSFNVRDVKIIYLELSKEQATKRLKLRGRNDDTDAGIAKRFDEYVNNVIPAMNYFKGKSGYTIYTINGEQTVENVEKDIIKALGY